MAYQELRKPFKIGSSTGITLPKPWCTYYGDRVKSITVLGSELLILCPEGLEDKGKRLLELAESGQGMQVSASL